LIPASIIMPLPTTLRDVAIPDREVAGQKPAGGQVDAISLAGGGVVDVLAF
jgi:hypothetical protein